MKLFSVKGLIDYVESTDTVNYLIYDLCWPQFIRALWFVVKYNEDDFIAVIMINKNN